MLARIPPLFPLQKNTRFLIAAVAFALAANTLPAAVPTDSAERGDVIGQPAKIVVTSGNIDLQGLLSFRQVVVTGHYAGGKVRDLTPFAAYKLENDKVASVGPRGLVQPKQDGSTTLLVQVGGKTTRLPVRVSKMKEPRPVSFRHDVIASLSVGGCSAGACHGTPSGKNGFRLSLRGYDPAFDYEQLTHDIFGRRTSRHDAETSLIMLKSLGRVAHGGGVRFSDDSIPARTLASWLSEGLNDDPADLAKLTNLEILPGSRVLQAPARWQQLAVLAHFSDGSVRDVTRLTVFTSSENSVAGVDGHGLVEFSQAGEVAILCRYLDQLQTVRLVYLKPREGFVWSNPPENNYVDRHVFAKLKMLNIQPSGLCSDEEFIRRAYLDTCAILPSAKEVRDFLADKDRNKRAKLIDRLLQRSEYADLWTMKWMDVMRNSSKTLHKNGSKAYHEWLHRHIERNTPLDRVVRELLTSEGSTFQNGPANYYRATDTPEDLAEVTAQLFMGVRMQCAKCHNHPFERWTQDDYYSTAAFFARVKHKNKSGGRKKRRQAREAIVYLEKRGDVRHLRTGKVVEPRFLDGNEPNIDKNADRREALARWLTKKDNPFFARSVVNRIWYHLMGRGIVDPVDDFRDSNPPANEELLAALAKDFVEHNFDVKHIIRTIMNSRTYQLSAASNKFNKNDNKYFSKAVTRILTAEQLLDAICTATGVPENYPGMPRGTRATQIYDSEINNQFLKTFGQPARELACECERGGDASLAQALQLLNGKTVHEKVSNNNNRIGDLLKKKMSEKDVLEELYLSVLTRFPTQREVQASLQYVQQSDDKRKAWEDVLWALLNTKEFMFRH